MKRKLALLTCAAVMAAMISACGSSASSGTAAPEPAAEGTTTEAVVQEEVTEEVDAATEAVSAAADEAASAATAVEEAAAVSETAAEAATAAATAAAAEEDVENGEITYNQMSQQIAAADLENIAEMDAEKQAPLTEVTDDMAPEDKGFTFANGEMYEYTAFKTGETADMEEYLIVYYDPVTRVLCGMMDVTHFNKSTGITEYQLRNFDISTIFPGFYDMPFATSMIYSYDDYYEFIVGFVDLDKPENVKIANDYGLLSLENYTYGKLVDGTSLVSYFRSLGYQEVSDYDLSKANINP